MGDQESEIAVDKDPSTKDDSIESEDGEAQCTTAGNVPQDSVWSALEVGEELEVSQSLSSALAALFALPFRPTRSLKTLFELSWPRFLFLLLFVYTAFPFVLHRSVEYRELSISLFFFVNKFIAVSPSKFLSAFELTLSLWFIIFVVCAGAVQFLLLRRFRPSLGFVDSVAVVTYSYGPFFVFFHLACGLSAMADLPVYAEHALSIQALSTGAFYVSGVLAMWAFYIWYRALYILTDIDLQVVFGTIMFACGLPLLIAMIGIVFLFGMTKVHFTEEPASFDHLQDQLMRKKWDETNTRRQLLLPE